MKNLLFVLACSCCPSLLSAQHSYAADVIPAALLQDADMVVRKYSEIFQVFDKGKGSSTTHIALTLLNANAEDRNDVQLFYNDLQQIENIEAAVYDAAGKLVRNLNKKDMDDTKFAEHFVNDMRTKTIHFPRLQYPYTIEYMVTYRLNGLMFYPVFMPQQSTRETVEHAYFEVKMPLGLKARFKENNILPQHRKGAMRWEFNHLNAIKSQPYAPITTVLDRISIVCAPNDFLLQGVEGNMTTWLGFGKFIQTLNADRTNLPLETQHKLQAMVSDCPTTACKVQRIYQYLQNNTRYFYVGLGIGGWQPSPAEEVDQLKYGDCKGLSNYMVAMLQAVDIPAYYTLIRGGEDEQNSQFQDFPNAWFNHAIVCVPTPTDTFWLECTSQTESFNFLSNFTDNRMALLITPEGGRLAHTPKYDETVNTIQRSTAIQLANDGSASLTSVGQYAGIMQRIPAELSEMNPDFQKKYMYRTLNVNDFEIKSLAFERNKGISPLVEQKMSLMLPKYASSLGKRLFLPLNGWFIQRTIPLADSLRLQPVQADTRGITESDSITINIPEGYTLETPPSTETFSSPFGHYVRHIQSAGNQITIQRTLTINAEIQPKEMYNQLIDFLKKIAQTDRQKLVLVK